MILDIPTLSLATLPPSVHSWRRPKQAEENAVARARRAREREAWAPLKTAYRAAKAAVVEADRAKRRAETLAAKLESRRLRAALELGRKLVALRQRLEPPRPPEAVKALTQAQKADFRAQFVGPLRPSGRRRDPSGARVAPVRPEIFGPPRPSRSVLGAARRAERHAVSLGLQWDRQAVRLMVRAVCALDKAAQAAQVAEARAAVEWDKASLKVLRAAWVELRKEATRERRLTWQREYARRKSMGDPERDAVRAEREASQARLEALHAAQQAALRAKIEADELRREAEAAAMAQRRAAALAEAQATATKIAGPVRVGRVAFVPPSRP